MTSSQKDQLTLDNSNEESKMVVSNTELRDKAMSQLEIFQIALDYKEWKKASAAMQEVKELLKQIN